MSAIEQTWVVPRLSKAQKRRAGLALVRMAPQAGAPRSELVDALEACGLRPYTSAVKVRVR